MLIGGHVSPAGGLVKAFERGVERDCDAIQIFNQSPRAWRHRDYDESDVAEFRELLAKGPVTAILIHAVYLINPASKDDVVRRKSLDALAHALDRLVQRLAYGRPRMYDDPVRADLVAHAQRVSQRV